MTINAQNDNGHIPLPNGSTEERLRGESGSTITRFAAAVLKATYKDRSLRHATINIHKFTRTHISAEKRHILQVYRAVRRHPIATRFALAGRGLAATFNDKRTTLTLMPVKEMMKQRKDNAQKPEHKETGDSEPT
ncbi:MAG: hypothetical protein HUU31_24155 [Anaerolineae bacterium]|nr:hypothetical protein [Anaerolineae bacterium]